MARNTGLELAQGTYLVFFDADDEYDKDLLSELVSAAEEFQVDEVFCLFSEHNYRRATTIEGLGFNTALFPDQTPVPTQDIKDLYRNTSWWCPNTLFRKEPIDHYHFRFSTTQVANDEFFMRAYASVSTTMLGLHKNLLTYRRHFDEQSLTSSQSQHTENEIEVLLSLHDWLQQHKLYDQHKESFLSYFVHSIQYNGSLGYRPQYIEAVAEALCDKGLFEDMDDQAFYNAYWKRYDTDKMCRELRKLLAKKPLEVHEIEARTNRLVTIWAIEACARERYGRMLNPPDSAGSTLKTAVAALESRVKAQGAFVK